MPRPKQHENAAQRQAAYRQRVRQAHMAQLRDKGLPPLPVLPTIPGQVRWQALLGQAQWALSQVCEEMEEYAAARSEAWQESERGDLFAERLEAVQELEGELTVELAQWPQRTAK
jgi:hypothetical protein